MIIRLYLSHQAVVLVDVLVVAPHALVVLPDAILNGLAREARCLRLEPRRKLPQVVQFRGQQRGSLVDRALQLLLLGLGGDHAFERPALDQSPQSRLELWSMRVGTIAQVDVDHLMTQHRPELALIVPQTRVQQDHLPVGQPFQAEAFGN